MTGRTLTQPALPITFGDKVARLADRAVLEAYDDLDALTFPVQVGGPGRHRSRDGRLGSWPSGSGLADAPPWHTAAPPGHPGRRRPGRAAPTPAAGSPRDVLVLGRPEIGELTEGTGGGSSSMPHKHNPVLSVLIRRAALTTPLLAATLHLAAADQVDERADGAWHAEWDTLRTARTSGRTRRRRSSQTGSRARCERAAEGCHARPRWPRTPRRAAEDAR